MSWRWTAPAPSRGVGTRNLLDVLNAEQELLNSRVTLVGARHDAYVLGFQLLAAMGKAEAADLELRGEVLYDPEINYKRVVHRVDDWDEDPRPVPVATRTVGLVSIAPPVAPAPDATRNGTKNPAASIVAPVPTPTTPVP